jgi:hypothetical protein
MLDGLPPGATRPDPADIELRRLAAELRDANRVLAAWHPRLGGGSISGDTVRIKLPGEAALRPTTDAEIAVVRSLELRGALSVWWPARCMRPGEDHAPLRDDLEELAQLL